MSEIVQLKTIRLFLSRANNTNHYKIPSHTILNINGMDLLLIDFNGVSRARE